MTWGQFATILGGAAGIVVLALLIERIGNWIAYGRKVVDAAPAVLEDPTKFGPCRACGTEYGFCSASDHGVVPCCVTCAYSTGTHPFVTTVEFDQLLEGSGIYDPDSPTYNAAAEFERNRAKPDGPRHRAPGSPRILDGRRLG